MSCDLASEAYSHKQKKCPGFDSRWLLALRQDVLITRMVYSSYNSPSLSCLSEYLRPLARSASNAAIFTPTTDPALIEFENSISNNNRMYVMKVLAADCSNQEIWGKWLEDARQSLSASGFTTTLICGDSDGTFPLKNCEKLRSLLDIPEDCFHIIKDAGHLAMIEKPVEVNQIIWKLLAELSCLSTNASSRSLDQT